MTSSIGFVPFYGLTPSINWLKQSNIDLSENDDREINVLLSEVADIRHILHTLSDALPLACGQRQHSLNIYLHDKSMEVLARDLLFLTLICETSYAKRERMEYFMDLYANTKLRDKTDQYL